jgi:DNA polymerase-3 subunit delta
VEGNLLAANQEIEKLRLLLGPGSVSGEQVRSAVADSSRFDVYKLADAALAGDAPRALRILDGVRAEGVDAVIVLWALSRDLRTLARISQAMETGTSAAAAFRAERVWESRQNLLRGCIGRHRLRQFFDMLQAARQADAVAKGQQAGDAWQLITNLVWQLSLREAAA